MRCFVVSYLISLMAAGFANPIVTKSEYESIEVPAQSKAIPSGDHVDYTAQHETNTQNTLPAYYQYYSTPSYDDVNLTTSYPVASTTDKYWHGMVEDHNKKYNYITETLDNYHDKMADEVKSAFDQVHQALSDKPKKYMVGEIASSSSSMDDLQKKSDHLKLALKQLEDQLTQMQLYLAMQEALRPTRKPDAEIIQRRPGGY